MHSTARGAGTQHTAAARCTGSSTLSRVGRTHIALLQNIIHVFLLDLQFPDDLPIILALIQPPVATRSKQSRRRKMNQTAIDMYQSTLYKKIFAFV